MVVVCCTAPSLLERGKEGEADDVEDKMFIKEMKYRPFSFGGGIRGMRPDEVVD